MAQEKTQTTGLIGIVLILSFVVSLGAALIVVAYPTLHAFLERMNTVDSARDLMPDQINCADQNEDARQVMLSCGGVAPASNTASQVKKAAPERAPSPPREGVIMPDSIQP